MKSAARLPQVPGCLDPANGKDSTLKVVPGAMHARRGLSQRVSYRVEQTCNRGGRLKDQKNRQLVQKLFYLWIRKTFGRVHPSQARTHYQQRILRKAFEVWREEWWVTRKEWRLSMRAECHYRYRLYNWVFVNWQQFVTMQQGRKERLQMAAIYAEKRCQFFAWGRWVVYPEMQRIKRNMHEAAQKHWENTALRSAWMLWTGCLQLKKRQLVLEECALQHWALSLQSRTWLQWREVYLLAGSLRKEETRASLHHSHGLQRRVLFTWTSYLHYRQVKKKQKVSSKHARHSMVLRRCWSTWQEEFLHRQNERTTWQTVSALVQERVQLRALHRWKGYTNQCLEETKINQFAREHYRRHLMHMGLRLLTLNISQRKARQINKNVALQQYQHSVIGKYWHRWQESYEEIEERNHQQQGDMALMHYRQRTCTWAFYTWLTQSEEQRDKRLAERMAVLHADQSALLRVFVHWRSRADWEREEREKNNASARLYLNTLLHKTLCLWRDNIALIQSGRENEQQAVRHDHLLCVQKALTRWRKYVQHKREKKRKLEELDHYRHCKLLARALHGWKEYHHRAQQANRIAEERQRLHHQNLLRKALYTWKENITLLVRDKASQSRASKQYQHILLSKVLLMWREATVYTIYSRHQQEEEVKVARTYLQGVCLQQAYQRWKKRGQEVRQERLRMEKARKNHQTALLHRCIGAWVLYYHQHQHRKVMQGQANCLLLRRTCLHYFTFWKRQLQLRYEEAELTDVALWHWSFKLLAKVMEAWRCWMAERHRKQDRLVHSVQFHQDQLLREGVMRILSHTADMRSFRISLALQSQEQSARQLQNVVWRCAMLWKQRALGEPGGCRGKTCKSVSFCLPPPISTPGSTSKNDTVGLSVCTSRLQPRRSDHLLNSLDKASPRKSTHNRTQVLSSPPSPANPIQTMGCPTPLAPELFCSPAIAQEPLTGHKGHSTNQEVLLPPSSFMTSGVSMQHSTSTLMAQPGPSHSDMLLSTKKFTMCQAAAPTGCVSEKGEQTECELVDQQPYCHASTAVAKELLGIQWKMHHFQREKRQLRAWRRLADVLRSWLQTSASEDETECHSTRLELEELEARMSRLATWLEEEKPVMQCYAARIHSISSCLLEN